MNYALYVACEEWHVRVTQKGKVIGEKVFLTKESAQAFAEGIKWLGERLSQALAPISIEIESVLKRAEELPPLPLDKEQVQSEQQKQKQQAMQKKTHDVSQQTQQVIKQIQDSVPKTLDSLFG